MDWAAIGAGIGGVFLGIGSTISWWQHRTAKAARVQAQVAEANADRNMSEAEGTLYKLLASRLREVEEDLKLLRRELATERQWARELEKHIYHLENTMREAGLTPPERTYVIG